MATARDILDKAHKLAAQPTFESVDEDRRIAFLQDRLAYYVALQSRSRFGFAVEKFTLTVDASTNEYSLPVPHEQFGGLYYVTTDPASTAGYLAREIDISNALDANLFNDDAAVFTTSPNQEVERIAVRGVGIDTKLVTYPFGASNALSVYYHVLPEDQTLLGDAPKLQARFHLGLLATSVALMIIANGAQWSDCASPEECEMKRAVLLDERNPTSLPNLLANHEGLFNDIIHRPDTPQISRKIQGHGSRRRRARVRGV